jgi:hypothetical protein
MNAAEQAQGGDTALLVLVGLIAVFGALYLLWMWLWRVALPRMALALLRRWYAAKPRTRLSIIATPIVLCWAWLEATWLLFPLVPAVLFLAGRTFYRWRGWNAHFIVNIQSVHDVLWQPLGLQQDMNPEHYLDIPVGLLEGEGAITITLPRGYWPTQQQKAEVVSRVAGTLGLKDYRDEWRMNHLNRHLHICSKGRSVPDVVELDDDFKRLMEAAPIHRKLVGRTTGDKPFYVDRKAENPHTLLTCPTGWGKTTAVGIELADTLHKGGEGCMCDIKYGSMRWAYDLDGVTYARTVEDIHRIMVRRVGPELLRRREVLGATHWSEEPQFTPIFFVFEEMNTLIEELRDFWVEERARLKFEARQNGEPLDLSAKSPAIKVYKQIGFMGRQLSMYMTVISQRGEANALGGAGTRGQLGNVVMGWPTLADWRMHAPQHPYVPHGGRPGRAHVVRGKHIHEVQYVKAGVADLRDWSTSGKTPANTLTQVTQANDVSPTLEDQLGHDPGRHLTLIQGEGANPPITLRDASSDQASDGGIVSQSLETMRGARKKDGRFPTPLFRGDDGADYYDSEALIEWSRVRNAARGRRTREA